MENFDLSHVQLFYNGKDIYASKLWFKTALYGFSIINKTNIKLYRLFKSLDKGFIPVRKSDKALYISKHKVNTSIMLNNN